MCKKPALSVIVPIYNVEKYLRRCLDSICSQSFADFECILVDDASLDNSPAICDEYCSKDNRFKVTHKPVNEERSKARKTGLDNADANFVVYADSDDWFEPDALQVLFEHQVANDADIVRARLRNHFDNYVLNSVFPFPYDCRGDPLASFFMNGVNTLCATLYRKSLFSGYIASQFSFGEDAITNVHLFSRSRPDKLVYINNIIYNYDRKTGGTAKSEANAYATYEDDPRYKYRTSIGKSLDDIKKNHDDVISAYSYSLLSHFLIPYVFCKKNITKDEISRISVKHWEKFIKRKMLNGRERKVIPIYNASVRLGRIYSFFMRTIVVIKTIHKVFDDNGIKVGINYVYSKVRKKINALRMLQRKTDNEKQKQLYA